MRSSFAFVASLLSVANLALAAPFSEKIDKRSMVEKDGVRYNVFEHAATGAKLEFVNNSGICETTPGVNQYSGYLSVGTNMNMWYATLALMLNEVRNADETRRFWLFEARENPTTAPLAAW